MASVVLTAEAREDVRDLDGASRKTVLKAMGKLRAEPEKRGGPLGSRSGGDLTTFRKLVVGDRDFRIVYRVEKDGSVCVVWVVAKRAESECYDLAMSRLKLYQGDLAREMEKLIQDAWQLDTTQ